MLHIVVSDRLSVKHIVHGDYLYELDPSVLGSIRGVVLMVCDRCQIGAREAVRNPEPGRPRETLQVERFPFCREFLASPFHPTSLTENSPVAETLLKRFCFSVCTSSPFLIVVGCVVSRGSRCLGLSVSVRPSCPVVYSS